MDPKILAIVALVVVGGIVAVVFVGGGGETTPSNETSGQETTTLPPEATTTTTTQGGSGETINIEGTWQGTYTSGYGQGTWKWVIKETSPGHYEGCLMTYGPYQTSDWLPMTVTVEGNQITLGSVGLVQVIFTGTVSGDSAQGNWHLAGGGDQGTWQGTKVSSENNLPCMEEPTTTTPPPSETTTTPSSGETTTTTQPSDLGCSPAPSSTLENAYATLSEAMITVFGADNLSCVNVPYSNETIYQFLLFIYGYSNQDVNTIGNMLGSELESLGWTDVTVVVPQPYMIEVDGLYYDNGYVINATIGIALAPTQSGANIVLTAEPAP